MEGPAPATWEEFDTALRALVPGLSEPLGPGTTLGELLGGDRIVKGLVSAALQQLLRSPPPELLTPDTTLREVYEWSQVRAPHAGEPVMLGPDAQAALKDMRTATIRLRPIMESDYPEMYASALDPRWSFRWRYRGTTPSMQEFVAQVSQGILSQFMVERLVDRRAIGLVSAYNARTDLGWAYLAFTRVSSPTTSGGSEMMAGGFLFITFLFRNWNFRKLYAEVPGWNWEQFSSGAGEFFTVEGVLTNHEYFDGRYWDQRIVALDRVTWETKAIPLLAGLYAGNADR